MTRLERLLGIALSLSARRRLKADELATRFSVSLRTIYRDVHALQEAGFPVVGTAGDGYLLPAGSQLRPLTLEPAQAEALVMGARLLAALGDATLRERVSTTIPKLEAVLSPEAIRRLREHEETVVMPAGFRSRAPGPLSLLLEAVNGRRVVEITYHGLAREQTTRREIEPLGLVRFSDGWMAAAFCRLRQDLRVFRTDRILEARATGERFAPRPGLTLQEFVRREREAEAKPRS